MDINDNLKLMESRSIFKTKLQIIPVVLVIIFLVAAIYLKFSTQFIFSQMAVPFMIWLFGLSSLIFIFACLIILIVAKLKKNDDYTLFKKTSLVTLEFIALSIVSFSNGGYLTKLFSPSNFQISQYIQKMNTLKIGAGVNQAEADSIEFLFKNDPSKIYDIMKKKGHISRAARFTISKKE